MTSNNQTGTILIVDDNPTNLDVLFDYLDRAGFDVFVAEDGESTLKRTLYVQPDIILLDVMMPGIDGFETCRRLKSNPDTQYIPVIFMTALADTADKVKGFKVGAIDYITKPFHYEEILARITTHLTLQNLQKDLYKQNSQLQQEITTRKQIEKELFHRAYHDDLTGLPNRTLFMNYLERSIERSKENKDHLFAVLFLDLDRFKLINDSLGHLVGDKLLITMARRLKNSVRLGDTVARLGGDEFAILLDNIPDANEPKQIADRIQHELALPIKLDGQEVFTTASIGIAIDTKTYTRPEEFLRNADVAMYQAKARGKARYELFDTSLHNQAIARLQLETDLWQALDRRELTVFYQPIVSLINGQITGVEALLRWQHPKLGFVSPAKFIPLAEETGLIEPIGEWLLRTACAQIGAWHAAENNFFSLAINMSKRQIQQPNIVNLIKEVLHKTQLPPQTLVLEIIEDVLTNEMNFTTLNELGAMGVKFSVDDFGVDSSFKLLKEFPLDALKIGEAFVQGITTKASDRAIIMAMINMAHDLNLTIIAKGIETQEQLAFLQQQQCDEVQGYLFSHPISAEQLTELLQEKQGYTLYSDDALHSFSSPDHIGYALVDVDLTITACDTAFSRWFSKKTNLSGWALHELLPEIIGLEDNLHKLGHNRYETITLPKIYRPVDDSFGRYFDLQFVPFLASNATLLVIVTDVTEQARLEFELKQERRQLHLEIIKDKQTNKT